MGTPYPQTYTNQPNRISTVAACRFHISVCLGYLEAAYPSWEVYRPSLSLLALPGSAGNEGARDGVAFPLFRARRVFRALRLDSSRCFLFRAIARFSFFSTAGSCLSRNSSRSCSGYLRPAFAGPVLPYPLARNCPCAHHTLCWGAHVSLATSR